MVFGIGIAVTPVPRVNQWADTLKMARGWGDCGARAAQAWV